MKNGLFMKKQKCICRKTHPELPELKFEKFLELMFFGFQMISCPDLIILQEKFEAGLFLVSMYFETLFNILEN